MSGGGSYNLTHFASKMCQIIRPHDTTLFQRCDSSASKNTEYPGKSGYSRGLLMQMAYRTQCRNQWLNLH
jgi:hypothetical protein